MIIVENDPTFRFPNLDKNRQKIWFDFAGKTVLGTHVFVYIPSYKTVVERVITGYKYYRSLKNCSWKQPWDDEFLYIDPLRPEINPGVAENTVLFQLSTPNGGRTRQISALVADDCCIWYYSAGHRVEHGFIYTNASDCYKDALREFSSRGISSITPAKDGVLNPQRMMLMSA